jgi:hypothetical protein
MIKYRDLIFDDTLKQNPKLTKDDVKQAVLSLLNGGTKDYKKIRNKPEDLVEFANEMEFIIPEVAKLNKSILNDVTKKRKSEKRDYNIEGAVMCRILQKLENECLEIMEEVFADFGIPLEQMVPIHDGMQVPRGFVDENLDVVLRSCENAIKRKTGASLQIVVKPMDAHLAVEGFEFPEPTEDNIKKFCDNTPVDPNEDIIKTPFNPNDNIYDMARTFETTVFSNYEEVIDGIKNDLSKCVRRIQYPPCYVINKGTLHKGTIYEEHPIDIEKEVNVNFCYLKPIGSGKDPMYVEEARTFNSFGAKAQMALPMYKTFTFEPNPTKQDSTIFNMFRGMRAKRRAVDMDKIRPILNHMHKAWFGGDDNLMDYMMHWFCQALSEPWNKTGVAVLLLGSQGTGKSFLGDNFFRPLVWGMDISITTQGVSKIGGRFNSVVMNKCLVWVNEVNSDMGWHETWDLLKSLITDPTITIEKKGMDVINDYPLPCNMILTTNNRNGVKLDPSDRRYFCVETSDVYRNNFKYFDELSKSMTQEVADMFYTYACDYPKTRNLRDIPITLLKEEMLSHTKTGVEMFYEQMIDSVNMFDRTPSARYSTGDDYEPWVGRLNQSVTFSETHAQFKATELYEIYKMWSETNREKVKSNRIFGQEIKKWVECKRTSKSMIYVMPVDNQVNEDTDSDF